MKNFLNLLCATSLLTSTYANELLALDDQFSTKTPVEMQNYQFNDLSLQSLDLKDFQPEDFQPQDFDFPKQNLAPPKYKSPFVAVGLSIVPGLGHAYLGEWKTATGLFGTACATSTIGTVPDIPFSTRVNSLIIGQNNWSYGLFAAYRDVRIYNGQRGYAYKMPMDSLRDLTSAPFRFSVLKKPEVWGGFIGAFALAITTAKFMFPQEAKFSTSLAPKYAISPFVALPIGIGEESLFRGLLQSSLSETFGQVGGIAISSLAFGAVHAPNAYAMPPEHRWRYYAFSMPLITTLGAYFGWVTQRNHSLQESVAIHTWYDFIIFAASAAATRASIMNRADFNFSADF